MFVFYKVKLACTPFVDYNFMYFKLQKIRY
jgi:hypothetical protein